MFLRRHSRSTASWLSFLPGSELRLAAERARQQVIDRKLDAIVVGGGDGSVRTVASVLAGSDIPVGIIPLGTLNHFAGDYPPLRSALWRQSRPENNVLST